MDPRFIIALILAAALFGAGWKVKSWQVDAVELAVTKTREAAQLGAADAIAKLEVKHTTIRQQVQTVVTEKVVYKECQHDQSTVDQINAVLSP